MRTVETMWYVSVWLGIVITLQQNHVLQVSISAIFTYTVSRLDYFLFVETLSVTHCLPAECEISIIDDSAFLINKEEETVYFGTRISLMYLQIQ
jgi:hypothetical protein